MTTLRVNSTSRDASYLRSPVSFGRLYFRCRDLTRTRLSLNRVGRERKKSGAAELSSSLTLPLPEIASCCSLTQGRPQGFPPFPISTSGPHGWVPLHTRPALRSYNRGGKRRAVEAHPAAQATTQRVARAHTGDARTRATRRTLPAGSSAAANLLGQDALALLGGRLARG